MADQTKILMTAAEFEALPESRHPIQLIEGELFEVPAPNEIHQTIVVRLIMLLGPLRPDGRFYVAPFEVFLDEHNVLEPDAMWVSPERQSIITDRRLEGAPDLVIEILSPSTARRDRITKFALYEKHGTREYWIVDPNRQFVEVWTLAENEFALLGTFGADESFASPLLGKVIDLAQVFNI